MKIVREKKLIKTYKVTCNIPVEIEVTFVDENHASMEGIKEAIIGFLSACEEGDGDYMATIEEAVQDSIREDKVSIVKIEEKDRAAIPSYIHMNKQKKECAHKCLQM